VLNSRPHPPTLAEILQIEDDVGIVDVLCPSTGLPVWPQVRLAYLRTILSDLVYGTELTGKSQTRVPAAQAYATLARSAAHNLHHRWSRPSHAAICMFGDGVANQLVDGKWFNRLADRFVLERPDQTLLVEDHFEWRWPFPRHHDNVIFHAPWQVASTVAGRLRIGERERRLAGSLIDHVIARSHHFIGWTPDAPRRARLVTMLAQKIASLPRQVSAYSRLLDRIRPNVLMVNAACYGPAAALIAVAKSKGIVTAESQHGVISLGHDAYNFCPAVLASDKYRHTLPDYLLTYGTWWNAQTNAPVKKLAIGNPHRTAGLSSGTIAHKTDLLVLSDGLAIERYLGLMRAIAGKAAQVGLRPVLRPHPLERTQVAALPAKWKEGFVVDTNPDIYTSFRNARVVVSEVSTGLFEAVGFADEIFMWATPRTDFIYPQYPFPSFETPEALGALLEQGESERANSVEAGDIWAGNWKQRYDDFLTSQGVPACATK
jgi:hypothetical protein